MDLKKLIEKLQSHANQKNVEGMARFGIDSKDALGVPSQIIKNIAKEIGTNHTLAQQAWDCGIHEAKWLAPLIADKKQINDELLEKWVHELNSWDICDNLMTKYVRFAPNAFELIDRWQQSEKEFVRRAGFALIAFVAVHYKKNPDEDFLHFFNYIFDKAQDDRNMVKKAVNWALRSLGKRSLFLREKALQCSNDLLSHYKFNRAARWIAHDAIGELNDAKIIARLEQKENKKATLS
jgi:3-methyladenine DNA glycosylase AlkD